MKYSSSYTLFVGLSRRLKIFSSNNELICDLNVNYPLPYMWNFNPELHRSKRIEDKIYFAIKVVNSILKKYEYDIAIS